ncbi:MAG TPA: hypothetical protein VML55_22340 [Planctomycetaceae bacterium]|nr:hypothetical protein [Planctomycetaceae bacterium]
MNDEIMDDALLHGVNELVTGRIAAFWVFPGGDCVPLGGEHRSERGASLEPEPLSGGRAPAAFRRPSGLLSGSFNPRHHGHGLLRDAAERRLGQPVGYELAVVNAEKPPLELPDVLRRARQFDDQPVVLTRAATFVEKAALLPETTFVVGIDTAARIVNTRFYGGSTREMHQALATIGEAGCRFLVAGRWIAGRFQTLSEIGLPARHARLFDELTAAEFRCDISSSELRGD